ncbi:hypothetical protein [Rossellomorea vietnamensis]|uniref:hypothetical protein n=1 Tax=Rossellomorea vietnamensis TaxID=218284 RepID=UPI001653D4AB|nr:hypothetical protein [Rossellomorea vietnamensis]
MVDKKELFLKELSELSKKHKIYIGGCGCCGSPYAIDGNDDDVFENLKWNFDKETYEA